MSRTARILMLGTALEGRGGVAAVVSVLREGGLFERESVRYLPTHVEGSRLHKALHAAGAFWHTACACAFSRPAIVHAHSASRASFLRKSLLLLLARAFGRKTIFHLHGGGFREYATVESGPLARRWIRHTLERSSLVIALTEGWARFLRAFAPRARVEVVPNAVPLPQLAPAGSERPGRILFLGRLEPAKGIGELLAAVAALAPRFPRLTLVLGGEGDAAAVRERAASLGIGDRVMLRGWMDGPARDAELAQAAVFCLPSHAEGLPMALLEAMAAAKAVLATTVGGIPEVVADGESGLLVPPRDAPALAAALARLLGDDELRTRLGRGARATIEQRYSTKVVGARLSALYRELAGAA